jgi:hypothetical protein
VLCPIEPVDPRMAILFKEFNKMAWKGRGVSRAVSVHKVSGF